MRREILNAIIECKDFEGETVVPHVNSVKLIRDAVFEALSAKGLLKIEEA
jgi:hypothetical protein